ncbi:MAG TPA: urease accessory protein UreD [Acidimicrobiales bacterium]|nr:urease accessory protein UreD [Acidimicrobiales bacterium]
MLASAELIVGPPCTGATKGWRTLYARHAAPVAFRECADGVYILGTAASPAGDDRVVISLTVKTGAHLRVRSVASTIAWASSGATTEVRAEIEPGGSLDWAPQPVVASARCDLVQVSRLHVGIGAHVRWSEISVAGRYGEQPGRLRQRLVVDYDGRPLLRHELALGPSAPGWDGSAVLGTNRCAGLVLRAGPEHSGAPARSGQGWATMPLVGPGNLTQAVGAGVAEVMSALKAGCA